MLFIDMEGLAHLSAAEEPAAPAPDFEIVAEADSTALDSFFSGESPGLLDESVQAGLDLGREAGSSSGYATSPNDPLGLNAFANSELSAARDGPLLFRIVISGIDSKEMRETIREAMTDPRFAWDVGALLSRIDKGNLTIENVAPVKASVLVNRLKRLPVTIRWEQHAVSQLEAPVSEGDANVES